MNIFSNIGKTDHEMVSFYQDKNTGLKGIVAVHDTTLGPAVGGLRIWPYDNEADALQDALNLSKAMTYKASLAGLNLGGGKGVIIADADLSKTEALLRSWGRFVDNLGGTYITTTDVGTNSEDMEWVGAETDHVVGMYEELGGSGDSSVATARGVFKGMMACIQNKYDLTKYNGTDLSSLTIGIEGFGKVGSRLAEICREQGMTVLVSDVNTGILDHANKNEYMAFEPDELLKNDIDIFAPCALGGSINKDTINQLSTVGCKIIAGCANNQLANNKVGYLLNDIGILYAPDYLINAGGLINASCELENGQYSHKRSSQLVDRIYDRMKKIILESEHMQLPTSTVADKMAENRIKSIAKIR